MKIKQQDIRKLNRLMAAEALLREILGDEGEEDICASSEDEATLYGLIHEMADIFESAAEILGEIGDLVRVYEDRDWIGDEDSDEYDDDEDDEPCLHCDICLKDEIRDDADSLRVMIAVPGKGTTLMSRGKAEQDYPFLFPDGDSPRLLVQIPDSESVFYTYASRNGKKGDGSVYVSSPVLVTKVDEEAGKFENLFSADMDKAVAFFMERETEITLDDGRMIPAFRLD